MHKAESHMAIKKTRYVVVNNEKNQLKWLPENNAPRGNP